MAREEHFGFVSHQGSVRIHGIRWVPEGEVRAVLQLAHGMTEHMERYREFGEYMAGHGILVVGNDHLGHGGSVSSPEDYGYFADRDGNRALIRDLHQVYRLTRRKYGDVPYVLLGHSMGSFLARQYVCIYGRELDGAIFCGTGSQPQAVVRTGLALCRGEARLFGWHYRSRLLRRLTFGLYNASFRPCRTSSDWMCSREEAVDQYLADPRCGFSFTLNGYYNLLLGIYKINCREYLERMPRDLPVLFISGEKDPVGNFGKGVREAEETFRRVGMRNTKCILYPRDRHEILNETDRSLVFSDLLEWLELRIL